MKKDVRVRECDFFSLFLTKSRPVKKQKKTETLDCLVKIQITSSRCDNFSLHLDLNCSLPYAHLKKNISESLITCYHASCFLFQSTFRIHFFSLAAARKSTALWEPCFIGMAMQQKGEYYGRSCPGSRV